MSLGSWRLGTQRSGPWACAGSLPGITPARKVLSPKRSRYRCSQLLRAWAPWGQFWPRGRSRLSRCKSSVCGPSPAQPKVRLSAIPVRCRVSWHSCKWSRRLGRQECQVSVDPIHLREILYRVHFSSETIQIRSQSQQTSYTPYMITKTQLKLTRNH